MNLWYIYKRPLIYFFFFLKDKSFNQNLFVFKENATISFINLFIYTSFLDYEALEMWCEYNGKQSECVYDLRFCCSVCPYKLIAQSASSHRKRPWYFHFSGLSHDEDRQFPCHVIKVGWKIAGIVEYRNQTLFLAANIGYVGLNNVT